MKGELGYKIDMQLPKWANPFHGQTVLQKTALLQTTNSISDSWNPAHLVEDWVNAALLIEDGGK